LSRYEDFAVKSSIKVAAMRRTHLLYIEGNCSSARHPSTLSTAAQHLTCFVHRLCLDGWTQKVEKGRRRRDVTNAKARQQLNQDECKIQILLRSSHCRFHSVHENNGGFTLHHILLCYCNIR